jgi:hypothetical protein
MAGFSRNQLEHRRIGRPVVGLFVIGVKRSARRSGATPITTIPEAGCWPSRARSARAFTSSVG